MDPPVQPVSWITAVLHKARPAQVDHHQHHHHDCDGEDDNNDNDDDDDSNDNDNNNYNINNDDNDGGFNRHLKLFNNTFMQNLPQKDAIALASALIIIRSRRNNGVDRGRRYFRVAAAYFHNSLHHPPTALCTVVVTVEYSAVRIAKCKLHCTAVHIVLFSDAVIQCSVYCQMQYYVVQCGGD